MFDVIIAYILYDNIYFNYLFKQFYHSTVDKSLILR